MVSAEDAARIYLTLTGHGFSVWVGGGWGVDALLGGQTRPHKDLDIIILLDDVVRLRALLEAQSYRLKELWSENKWVVDGQGVRTATAFALHDGVGGEIDVHAMKLYGNGGGAAAWDAEGFVFAPQDLSGEGVIGGVTVRCLSPGMQVRLHTGYELPEAHRRDLELITQKFKESAKDEKNKESAKGAK